MFTPSLSAAQQQLAAFIPNAGAYYAQQRNFDFGPDNRANVSTLSPYIRRRVLTEATVLKQVLTHHSPKDAEKFIQEIFWRTYWKGWLELRPWIWQDYRTSLDRHINEIQTQSGLRQRWVAACTGATGIDCFDSWAKELAETGYLHNHARMWFASIWIFTLELPWELGADFFIRHLLDGDPASNTLSWRWVAGKHTVGKAYLATAENISKFTSSRFDPKGLRTALPDLPDFTHPKPRPLDPRVIPTITGRVGVLTHDDDFDLGEITPLIDTAISYAHISRLDALSPLAISDRVTQFVDQLAHNHAIETHGSQRATLTSCSEIIGWAEKHQLDMILTPYAPVGPMAVCLADAETACADLGIRLVQIMTGYDARAWPKATHGFFRFKSHFDDFMDRLCT